MLNQWRSSIKSSSLDPRVQEVIRIRGALPSAASTTVKVTLERGPLGFQVAKYKGVFFVNTLDTGKFPTLSRGDILVKVGAVSLDDLSSKELSDLLDLRPSELQFVHYEVGPSSQWPIVVDDKTSSTKDGWVYQD